MGCCKNRRKKEPRPESVYFKPLTPEYLAGIREKLAAEKREADERKRKEKERLQHVASGGGDAASGGGDDDGVATAVDNSAAAGGEAQVDEHPDERRKRPNKKLVQGKSLSPKYLADFQNHLAGIPLIDIDPFYAQKEFFCVIGRDKNISRFSASDALWVLSPFNPVRRLAIATLVHPLFSALVIVTILVNCIFMAMGESAPEIGETICLAVYTTEFVVKLLARGFILKPFTYLRDPWNYLDFSVICLAYLMMVVTNLGNLSALRTFRVLRALKTVAVIPGLKTIVGALMEAVIRLRDVMILTLFVLSIFALVGLQLYMGSLHTKCVKDLPDSNITDDEWFNHTQTPDNWFSWPIADQAVCGNGSDAGHCPENYTCLPYIGDNPNYGYTNWDNFGWTLLNAFRLMTQDYWESLYYLTIRANGLFHMFFFVIAILLGSFYLVNLTLAIVAMSYDEQQKRDQAEQNAEEAEKKEEEERKERELSEYIKSASNASDGAPPRPAPSIEALQLLSPKTITDVERVSLRSIDRLKPDGGVMEKTQLGASLSLPGSPLVKRKQQQQPAGGMLRALSAKGRPASLRLLPLATSSIAAAAPMIGRDSGVGAASNAAHATLPYADDSAAVTPLSVDVVRFFDGGEMPPSGDNGATAGGGGGSGSGALVPAPAGPLSNLRGSIRSRLSARSRSSSRRSRHHPWSHLQQQSSGAGDGEREHSLNHLDPERGSGRILGSVDDDTGSTRHKRKSSILSLTGDNVVVDIRDVIALKDLAEKLSRRTLPLEDPPTKGQLIKAKLQALFCSWTCCPAFLTFQKYVDLLITDAFMEVFITLCILCNTVFMAMDHYGKSPQMEQVLEKGNYFFTGIFTFECVSKLLAFGPGKYFKEAWNSFDFFIVALSLIEFGLDGVSGLSVLRSFRLLRVLKLAKSWPTLNLLLGIIGRTLSALANLTFILGIVIFIFAIVGNQLFGEKYTANKHLFPGGVVPRWSFKDFFHSFMIVFRVLCGEWIESMWNCMRVAGWTCIPFFMLSMVIGKLVVLNLFLALLLSSFSGGSLSSKGDDEPNKIAEAVGRVQRFVAYIKKKIVHGVRAVLPASKRKISGSASGGGGGGAGGEEGTGFDLVPLRNGGAGAVNGNSNGLASDDKYCLMQNGDDVDCSRNKDDGEARLPLLPSTQRDMALASPGSKHGLVNSSMSAADLAVHGAGTDKSDGGGGAHMDLVEVEVEYVRFPDDCCCAVCYKKISFCQSFPKSSFGQCWWGLRCFTYRLVEHKYFETFIIVCILLSSVSLAIEDVHIDERPLLKAILNYTDKVFSAIFFCEMIIKWLAFGYRKYFTDAWCWLDFVIVGISVSSLILESMGLSGIGAFKAMRTLRALRPLRAVSRWEGMRVVVNALIQAIPAICNVLLVILLFWLIFAIMAVNFFAGKFHKCVDDSTGYKPPPSVIANKTQCLAHGNYSWRNSEINFDNVGNAYLALLQIATFKGWVEIMYDAVDAPDKLDGQPEEERVVAMYIYFVCFIIFGSFFTLNLFIGVIIDNFNAQKKKAGGSIEMFMTEDQKKYYNAMKKLQGKHPQKAIPRPEWKVQALVFDFTTNQKFDIAIMIFIMLNMITMCLEHSRMTDEFKTILDYVNLVFIVVFTLECVLKIFSLRWYYFKYPWNIFDFVVVIFSIVGQAAQKYIEAYLELSPTVLRVVRVFRVGRVLRLVKSAKGIRTLLFSLMVSLPALFNIGLLLFLVMFIYSTFGMAFFMHIKPKAGVDDLFNFKTFFRGLITLFQASTSAGWNGVLTAIFNTEDCSEHGNGVTTYQCGNPTLAVAFMVSYLLLTFLVIVNMYIAVILENFSQATSDVQEGLTQDDFDMYYERWEKFDPQATHYIGLSRLTDFVDQLEEPLKLPKPNYFKLVTMRIPICEGDKVHCTDILDALTKNFLGTSDISEDLAEATPIKDRGEGYHRVSDTLCRQQYICAARIIQKAYRRYRTLHPGGLKLLEFTAGDGGDKGVAEQPPPPGVVVPQIEVQSVGSAGGGAQTPSSVGGGAPSGGMVAA